jgi:hypothetical protein
LKALHDQLRAAPGNPSRAREEAEEFSALPQHRFLTGQPRCNQSRARQEAEFSAPPQHRFLTGAARIRWIHRLAAGCYPDGSCAVTTESGCAGVWHVEWPDCGVAQCPQPLHPGDLGCDGVVDFADINPFVLAISDPVAYQAACPNCNYLNGDCNGDGSVDFDDINPFVAILSGGEGNRQ